MRQRGAVVLISVVMLMVLVGSVTAYTARVKSLEYKIMLNEQNQTSAFFAAEAGLMHGLGELASDPDWDGTPVALNQGDNTSFNVSAARQQIDRVAGSIDLITLTASGTSADGLANSRVQEQAILYSVLANPPDVPLIVSGGLHVSGNFEVAANPNGGGTGVPLSIWSDGEVDMNNGSGTTCGLQEFSDGVCSSQPYSEKGFQDLDIVDNDPNFPTDLFQYMFNLPESQWPSLRADADQRLTSCDSLGPGTLGLIWVDGSCSINANAVVGSPDDPVILVVSDGDITMNGGAVLNGILFSFRKPGTLLDFELNMVGGAQVNGVVASNHQVGHSNGTYNAVYDADVLAQIMQHDAFKRVARVPGSWRDF